MQLRSCAIASLALLLAMPLPAVAADPVADPASPVGKAGQVILDAVAGRSYADAFAKSQSPSNPFGIDLDKVAAAVGATATAGDISGGLATEGHLSILPQFNTPEAKFGASATTPAIIPFAAMVAGKCLGGYAMGYPSATKVFATEMLGRVCSATAIARALGATYPLKVAVAEVSKPATSSSSTVATTATTAVASTSPAKVASVDNSFTGATGVAPAGSDVDRVGQVVLQAVGGRSADQAISGGGSKQNPFDLSADPLLAAAGVYFLNTNDKGTAIDTSEFSIYPDYVTPGGKYFASEKTPPIMPFAFNRGGTCYAGYVTGFPVPNAVYAVDMHGKVCSAKTVDDSVGAAYRQFADAKAADATSSSDADSSDSSADKSGSADSGAQSSDATPAASGENAIFDGTSANASDHDLEMIVFGAYTGAYNQALKHNNYFSSADFSYADLRSAIRDALEKEGYGATEVADQPVASDDATKACATDGKVSLRIAFNDNGVGITLAAVSDKRMSAYGYFPDKSSDLAITHASDCLAPGSTSAPADSGDTDRLKTPTH